ncbi:CAP domain-containing protein [Heyndrickxia sporothermodurans]|nr:CAP domain-containing protein [Heyndrickxia sporothermodurans]MBL5767638.1 CAP domain-containing protein [Heyndrickxia sporothermodurans]MBL5771141.1 CAP domain-containing protein [Heyndrickxia sporothermodurans]MBL5775073.1 CAP domain-containing protein [Heyndrickxia sporothermodurans]MBL5778758.1 CAP domain-containing protein [Heyndrickxia sporothermodurans]MBL5782035.1 CAP domain-containing protein [Heyndrickxia sporothermodurans]
MIRFIILVACICLFIFSWPTIDKKLEKTEFHETIDLIESKIENFDIKPIIDKFQHVLNDFGIEKNEQLPIQQKSEEKRNEKVSLKSPNSHMFSIHNIEIGDRKKDVEKQAGMAKRASMNEYGTKWFAYHENYHHFFMTMYDKDNRVIGLYSNQNLITSTNGIKLGVPKKTVRTKLGEPLSGIRKGLIMYQFQKNSEYDVYLIDDMYVTIFYDKHSNNTVTAIQLISKNVEQQKKDYYTKPNQKLVLGFEYQLFDLTNSSRVNHHLPILSWDQHVQVTARNHSKDMAEHQFFDHTNLKGQSPFDRMSQDHIRFLLAGENIAYGQLSSIFAHEGLMNSLGHRKNILHRDYKYLGTGVAFNEESQPFYTQDFYAK